MGGYMSTNRTPSSTDNNRPQSPPKKGAPLETGRYRLPAEWNPHLATIMGFPKASCLESLWEKNCEEIVDLAGAVADFEPVRLADSVQSEHHLHTNQPLLGSRHGPTYVHDATGDLDPQQRLAISFEFNEWGNKNGLQGRHGHYRYGNPSMTKDRLQENTDFARNAIDADHSPSPVQRAVPRIRADNGGLIVDGEGTLIISESYMVCEQRNPGRTRDEIEQELCRLLGFEKVIWCPGRKNLDITDSHLDTEVRFVKPGVVVLTRHSSYAIDGPEWRECENEILEILKRETDAKGRPFEIHFIEEPDPTSLGILPNDEFVSSYLNSYFCNGSLIIPGFGSEEHDRKVRETWQALLPDRREVRQVPLRTIPLSGGVIHCVTQQVPAAKE